MQSTKQATKQTSYAELEMQMTGRPLTARDKAVMFFYEHAGSSYNPATETLEQGKMRGAMRLADAEAWALAEDLEYTWELEQEDPRDVFGEFCSEHGDCAGDKCPYIHGDPDAEHFVCTLWTAGSGKRGGLVMACLGMIESPSREYRRVIEAELALEAMPHE